MNAYAEKYLIAYDLCKDNQYEEGAKAAMQALIDMPGMPPYWQIKNCTLIAWVLDEWYSAEDFRTLGEEIFELISKEGSFVVAEEEERLTDEEIKELREDLDKVAEDQKNQEPVEAEANEEGLDIAGESEATAKTDDDEANEIEALMDEFGKQTVSRESNALYVVRQSLNTLRANAIPMASVLEEGEKDKAGGK